jgi:hypothetical protein
MVFVKCDILSLRIRIQIKLSDPYLMYTNPKARKQILIPICKLPSLDRLYVLIWPRNISFHIILICVAKKLMPISNPLKRL